MTSSGRRALVVRARARLVRHGSPRTHTLIILAFSGGVAFLSSVAMLRMGLELMAWRYPLAAVAGYAAFLVFIRVWVALQRGEFESHSDFHVADLPLPSVSDGDPPPGAVLFAGGSSGGGGGGAEWGGAEWGGETGASAEASNVGDAFSTDASDFWPAVIVVAAALGGVLVLLYVVYIAPLLLAEVIVDAAVVAGVYRRMQQQDAVHWTTSVVRRTWVPAVCMVLFLMAAGFGLQRIEPSARSIGGVVRALLP